MKEENYVKTFPTANLPNGSFQAKGNWSPSRSMFFPYLFAKEPDQFS